MAKASPIQFFRQVRSEVAKVTWPNRKETLITTGMVFVMVSLASVFLLLTDWVVSSAVRLFISSFGG